MKISCVQMNMALGRPDENFDRAGRLIAEAAAGDPDVIVLPETWNTGFFPRENLAQLADSDCARLDREIGSLAKTYGINLVAGSVANQRNGKVFNTCCVYDRSGAKLASYDKTHLFTPMGEHHSFTPGDHLCRFSLDGVSCGVIICYDIRFPELARSLALGGMDVLFIVSQWPRVRIPHLRALTTARAIENQCFAVCCNSCGTAGETVYGGASSIVNPWGETLALAGETEQTITADCDLSVVRNIRETINVFHDRRPEIYSL
jgi:omega-amidase